MKETVAPEGSLIIGLDWLGDDCQVLVLFDREEWKDFTSKEGFYHLLGEVNSCTNGISCVAEYGDDRTIFYLGIFREERRVIYHESLHVVHQIMDFKGIPLDGSTSEVQAYLQGFIAEKIHEAIEAKE